GLRQVTRQGHQGVELAIEDAREPAPKARVAGDDSIQPEVEEAKLPDPFEQQVQVQPQVLEGFRAAARRAGLEIDAFLEAREELGHDGLLAAEVVVEVAR